MLLIWETPWLMAFPPSVRRLSCIMIVDVDFAFEL
jgi:hypothetical protein